MRLRVEKWMRLPALLMVAASLLTAVPGRSQEPAAPSAAPAPIPVSGILSRADTDERYAEKVTIDAQGPDPTARLLPELNRIIASVDDKQQELTYDGLLQLPVSRLESLGRHWKFDARRVDRWRDEMRRTMSPFGVYASQLAQRRAEWEATRGAGAATLSPALTERVDAVINRLREAEQALSVPLTRQIELGRRANSLDGRIESGLGSVTAAIDRIDSQLLRIDSPPLWKAGEATSREDTLAGIRRALEIESRFVRDYHVSNTGHHRELAVVLLLLLPLLLWLSHSSGELDRATVNPDTLRILRRPFSIWLLLSMMAVLTFEQELPLFLQRLALLIALVPVLRLVPQTGRHLLGIWPYVAAMLYLLLHIGAVVLSSTSLYRYFLFAISILTLALLAWQRGRGRRLIAGERRVAVVRAIGWVAMALLLAAALAIGLGSTSLGETLTSGVINSGYFGLMVYTGTAVMTVLVGLLLSQLGKGPARNHASPLVKVLVRVLAAGAAFGWIVYTLHAFRVYRPTYAFLKDLLSREFSLGSLSLTLGSILVFFIAATIAFWSARIVRLLLRDEILSRMSLPRGVAESVSSLTYYMLIMLGFIGALAAAGFKVSQLTLVFGALGVGIGFGLQNVVNNFVSGLILMFERPIRPGDFVDVSGIAGRVINIGMRATTIRIPDGAEVVVPNGTLLANNVVNWTLLDTNRRIEVPVGVAYGSDPVQVAAIVKQAAGATAGVALNPEPVVLFQGMGDSSLKFLLQVWTGDFDRWAETRSDLSTQVYSALEKAGFELPYPQQDLHLRSISTEAAAIIRPPVA